MFTYNFTFKFIIHIDFNIILKKVVPHHSKIRERASVVTFRLRNILVHGY